MKGEIGRKNVAQLVRLATNLPLCSRKTPGGVASRFTVHRGPSPEGRVPVRGVSRAIARALPPLPRRNLLRRGDENTFFFGIGSSWTKSSICEELVLENLTSRKLNWANEEPRWAVLPRRPFQTHISTISVQDAKFSAKKGGTVASRPAKRQYHERHFTIGKRSRQKLHASHNARRGKRSLRRVGFPMAGQLECKAALKDARLVL